jgi:DNA-binding beta-propeller fold protein YncE
MSLRLLARATIAFMLAGLLLSPRGVNAGPPTALFENGQDAFTVIGQVDFTTTDGTGPQDFDSPQDIAVDLVNGKVYIADTIKNRILRYKLDDISNRITDNIEMVFGQANLSGFEPNAGGSVAANTLFQPAGMVVDSAGRLWVADTGNNRVLRFDTPWIASDFADADGVLGQADLTSSTPDVTQSGMTRASDVAISADGVLFAVDAVSARVLRWDNAATKADGAPADGVLGQPDFVSNFSGTGPGELTAPSAAAFDDSSGALFVTDDYNNRVLRWDDAVNAADGAPADGILGQLDLLAGTYPAGTTDTLLSEPAGAAVDSSGRLYIVDRNNNRVVYWNDAANRDDGAPMDGVLGQPDFTSSNTLEFGADPVASLAEAEGIGIGPDTMIFVADNVNNRVMVWKDDTVAQPESGRRCDVVPDLAVSPQYITLEAGGTAELQVAVRNIDSRDHGYADLLVSLSDGLTVTGARKDILNLGQRAAWQQLLLSPNETRTFTLTVTAAETLPAAPVHVTEWYCGGRMVNRIDGVFLTAAQTAELTGVPTAAEVPAAAETSAAEPLPVIAPLPAQLPNTGGSAGMLLGLSAAAVTAAAAGYRLRRR